ncbi:MAG: helix-turn-helix transcriptional regulator [Agathobacter sp.]|nr:helix-turn-helix transcriptional regulator [Agathobacter sp.]
MTDKLLNFYQILDSTYPILYWEYNAQGDILSTNAEDKRLLDILFSANDIKTAMITYGQEHDMPLIISSKLGNLWVALFDKSDTENIIYHVIGPLYTDMVTLQKILKQLDDSTSQSMISISLKWKKRFLTLAQNFTTIPWNILTQYIIMLHFIITEERISASDFAYLTGKPETLSTTLGSSDIDSNLPWQAEQALMNNIREGNMNYQIALANAANVSFGVHISIGDPLRQAKDSGIVFSTLCSRAAIDGGLPAHTAYTVQNMYSQSLESAKDITEIASINHQMYVDFIQRVHKVKTLSNVTPPIRSCMEYIDFHITEKIEIAQLAASIGYSTYYLSRKFKSETGHSINNYIKQKKMQLAKHLLTASSMSVQDISAHLNYCSNSYFSDLFHKETGLSPNDYREQHKKL